MIKDNVNCCDLASHGWVSGLATVSMEKGSGIWVTL